MNLREPKTVKFINNKGIGVSFCMPIIKTKTSFSLGGDCASLSSEELRKVILEIISLKKKGFKIINNIIFFEEILRFLEGKNKYYCFGGKKLFYLDWNLNVYPCMFKGNSQKIYNFNFDFNDDICNECLLQCFREPSIFLISQPIASISFLKEFKTYLALYHKNLLLIQYLKHLHTVLKKIYQ